MRGSAADLGQVAATRLREFAVRHVGTDIQYRAASAAARPRRIDRRSRVGMDRMAATRPDPEYAGVAIFRPLHRVLQFAVVLWLVRDQVAPLGTADQRRDVGGLWTHHDHRAIRLTG